MLEPKLLEETQSGFPSHEGTEMDSSREKPPLAGSNSFSLTAQNSDSCSSGMASLAAARSAIDEDKFCCVCGDRALGYNFDAITCESCKAFFRRNAAKHEVIKCMFTGDCSITINTRRFCSACRLRKCFLVGMKKDMILGEQEKRYRKEKVLLNKEKRLRKQQLLQQHPGQTNAHNTAGAAAGGVTSATSPPLMLVGPSSLAAFCAATASRQTPVLSSAVHGGGGSVQAREANAATCAQGHSGSGMRVLSRDDSSSCSVDSCIGRCSSYSGSKTSGGCSAGGQTDGTAPSWSRIGIVHPFLQDDFMALPAPAAGGMRRELSVDEVVTLGTLERTYTLTIGIGSVDAAGVDCDDGSGRVQWGKCNNLEFFLNHTGSFVRRHVTFAKRLQEFILMPQEAQVSLLKASVLSCMILRSAHVYDLASDCWVNSRGVSTSLDVLSSVFSDVDPGMRDLHSNLVRSIKQLVKAVSAGQASDSLTFALLQCIALLSPEHIRPSDDGTVVAAVSDAQLRYVVLLRHHLEATLSYAAASELLPNLLQCLTMCKYYAQQHGKAIMSCDAARVEPLLREVFNL